MKLLLILQKVPVIIEGSAVYIPRLEYRQKVYPYVWHLIDNVVCIELLRRGYAVYVGKFVTREVDFVCGRGGGRVYIQVAYVLTDAATVDREFAPLLAIEDHYPKLVVTMDPVSMGTRLGVRHVLLREFLLNSGLF